MQICQDY